MVKVVNAQAPCRASRGARLYSTIANGVGFTTTLCPRDPHSRVRWGDLFARAWPASARTRGDGNEDLTGLHFPFAWTWSLLVRSARLRLILCALTRCIVICFKCAMFVGGSWVGPTRTPTAPNTTRGVDEGRNGRLNDRVPICMHAACTGRIATSFLRHPDF